MRGMREIREQSRISISHEIHVIAGMLSNFNCVIGLKLGYFGDCKLFAQEYLSIYT